MFVVVVGVAGAVDFVVFFTFFFLLPGFADFEIGVGFEDVSAAGCYVGFAFFVGEGHGEAAVLGLFAAFVGGVGLAFGVFGGDFDGFVLAGLVYYRDELGRVPADGGVFVVAFADDEAVVGRVGSVLYRGGW